MKRSEDQNVVSNRWVLKRKISTDGKITRYKPRLVARGFRKRTESIFMTSMLLLSSMTL